MFEWVLIAVLLNVASTLPSNVRFHTIDEVKETRNSLINQTEVCRIWPNPIVILIKSGPGNVERRNTLRSAWIREAQTLKIPYLFVMGSDPREDVMNQIYVEAELHKDIIQGSFLDTYYNLTLKGMFAFRWLRNSCNQVDWVFMCDDDTIINFNQLLKFVVSKEANRPHRTLYCRLVRNATPFRDTRSKWYVSHKLWGREKYPDYCSGGAYIMTGDSIEPMSDAISAEETNPKLYLDDVYLTGIAAKKAEVTREAYPGFTFKERCSQTDYDNSISLSMCGEGRNLLDLFYALRNNGSNNGKDIAGGYESDPLEMLNRVGSEAIRKMHELGRQIKGLALVSRIMNEYIKDTIGTIRDVPAFASIPIHGNLTVDKHFRTSDVIFEFPVFCVLTVATLLVVITLFCRQRCLRQTTFKLKAKSKHHNNC